MKTVKVKMLADCQGQDREYHRTVITKQVNRGGVLIPTEVAQEEIIARPVKWYRKGEIHEVSEILAKDFFNMKAAEKVILGKPAA